MCRVVEADHTRSGLACGLAMFLVRFRDEYKRVRLPNLHVGCDQLGVGRDLLVATPLLNALSPSEPPADPDAGQRSQDGDQRDRQRNVLSHGGIVGSPQAARTISRVKESADTDRLVRQLGNLQLRRGQHPKKHHDQYEIAQVGPDFNIVLAVWYARREGYAALCFLGARPLGEGIAPSAFWELIKEGQPLADKLAAYIWREDDDEEGA